MKVKLTKIPSIARRLELPHEVEISDKITPEEGAVIVVEALSDEGKNNVLDFASGRLGRLVEGDVIPGVLGKRRALREYSGNIPTHLQVGDILYLICESGMLSEIKGVSERWGTPMKVRVLGSLVQDGKHANLKDKAIAWRQTLEASAPVIVVAGTCMDTGKTTMICKLVKHFAGKGLKVAAVKLAGTAFTQDPLKIKDHGANPVMDFADGGLPSTCGDPEHTLQVALGLLAEVNKSNPDLIIAEFGDAIMGEYNVEYLLRHPELQKHIVASIVAASDIVAAWGTTRIMAEYGVPLTLITGPVVNNETGVEYLEKQLGVAAESNLHSIPKTARLLEEKLGLAQGGATGGGNQPRPDGVAPRLTSVQ